MLRAIWVDNEDERIISEALIRYLSECAHYEENNPYELPRVHDLLRIRTLTNRIKRAKETHEKSL